MVEQGLEQCQELQQQQEKSTWTLTSPMSVLRCLACPLTQPPRKQTASKIDTTETVVAVPSDDEVTCGDEESTHDIVVEEFFPGADQFEILLHGQEFPSKNKTMFVSIEKEHNHIEDDSEINMTCTPSTTIVSPNIREESPEEKVEPNSNTKRDKSKKRNTFLLMGKWKKNSNKNKTCAVSAVGVAGSIATASPSTSRPINKKSSGSSSSVGNDPQRLQLKSEGAVYDIAILSDSKDILLPVPKNDATFLLVVDKKSDNIEKSPKSNSDSSSNETISTDANRKRIESETYSTNRNDNNDKHNNNEATSTPVMDRISSTSTRRSTSTSIGRSISTSTRYSENNLAKDESNRSRMSTSSRSHKSSNSKESEEPVESLEKDESNKGCISTAARSHRSTYNKEKAKQEENFVKDESDRSNISTSTRSQESFNSKGKTESKDNLARDESERSQISTSTRSYESIENKETSELQDHLAKDERDRSNISTSTRSYESTNSKEQENQKGSFLKDESDRSLVSLPDKNNKKEVEDEEKNSNVNESFIDDEDDEENVNDGFCSILDTWFCR